MKNPIEVRKIQVAGKSSLAVTIPKRWAEVLGINAGNPVYLEFRGYEIAVLPALMVHDVETQRVIEVKPGESSDSVIRRVISAFIKGAQVIRVMFTNGIDRELIDEVTREISVRVPIVETISYGNGEVKVTVLSPTSNMPIKSFIARMSNVVSGMFKDALSLIKMDPEERLSVARDIMDRDYDVDRNYMLIHRLINMAVNGLISVKSVEIDDRPELLSCLLVSKSLERSGDHSWRIAQWMLEVGSISEDVANLILTLGDEVNDLHKSAVSSFLSKDVDKAQAVLDMRNNIAQRRVEVNNALKAYNITGPLNLVIESVGRLAAYAYDIAEITLDTYL
ncbi:phosphate signaling complex PhoU family protein [Caldivirga sp. UBA161]|uniref:phosphate signaling complex PhoU family protein n=1 Tax=Caldivirga sp. UBA161 TaxID=1915569 RepID=UPI0025C49511|nr:phosphate uptake regulator PhoU [Caldivirga sp. UBA161]